MADGFVISVEDQALLEALATIPDVIMRYAKPAAKVTAENIAGEIRRRFARAQGGPTRGSAHTADTTVVEETRSGDGYIVVVASLEMPMLPYWLEFGTKKMLPHPAGGVILPAARIEEGPHGRRMREAIQAGIDEKGLGD